MAAGTVNPEAQAVRSSGRRLPGCRTSSCAGRSPPSRWASSSLIAFFFIRLYGESRPLFNDVGIFDFVFSNEWVPSKNQYGALPLVVGTLITSAIALAIGVPVAVAARGLRHRAVPAAGSSSR